MTKGMTFLASFAVVAFAVVAIVVTSIIIVPESTFVGQHSVAVKIRSHALPGRDWRKTKLNIYMIIDEDDIEDLGVQIVELRSGNLYISDFLSDIENRGLDLERSVLVNGDDFDFQLETKGTRLFLLTGKSYTWAALVEIEASKHFLLFDDSKRGPGY